ILDRMEDRARMRLHRNPVLRTQHVEIERGHDRCEGSRRGLMPADLHTVDILAQVIGVMDRPARKPQHLLLEFAQKRELVDAGLSSWAGTCHCHLTSFWLPMGRAHLTPNRHREPSHPWRRSALSPPS